MNIKDDFILSEINEGYLVGGSVRDFLCGKVFVDRDIAIKGAEKFAGDIANKLDATFVVLDSENLIYRVVLKDKINYLDITEMQGETIEDDLMRRDFTINAIAFDLANGSFIDIVGGQNDLKNKVLRQIQDKNFEDDPLRILRAFRFMATTGFDFAPELKEAVGKYKNLILKPAKERISYELIKLFGGEYAFQALVNADKYGILEDLFPCINEMKQVPPNTHHHLDLFHHSLETVRNIELLYLNSDENIKKHLDIVSFGGFPRINHLKLSAFLHDIGKFSTWIIEEDTGRHRFIKHDDVGAKMCVPLLKDLKFSKKQIEYVSLMIKNHIYPSNVISSLELTDKIMMRYVRKMNDNVIDNIFLAKADRLSARGVDITDEMVETNITGLNNLLKFYMSVKDTLEPLPKLLDGLEIMEIKNISQSPLLGKIINELHEAQLNGIVNTRDEAIEFVNTYEI
ncbi:MAG: HD domain-containing protein [bacterium]|nr:HD domain-containing protein [bacterium]